MSNRTNNRTLKGYCAPHSTTEAGVKTGPNTCYSKGQLITIIKKYNQGKSYAEQITPPHNASPEKLWQLIDQKMGNVCNTEWCWLNQTGLSELEDRIFLPPAPKGGPKAWLSTLDIERVLQQYMRIHKNFLGLGPVAIDFCSDVGNAVCNMDIKKIRDMGKTKIGIVFNTDPISKPGQHWICMYIDISPRNPNQWSINYFDSYGMAPLPNAIRSLVEKLQAQNKKYNKAEFKLEMNCKDISGICTRSVRQQKHNTECGMYCINFIVERLTGKSWDYMVSNIQTDEKIFQKRPMFFRPL
jgi:hypothetical protein